MRLTIGKMTIQNFKGIRELVIDFADETHIYGMNGTGKTTIPDAFSWVLWNKDARGNAPGTDDFREKPLDQDGNEVHNLDTMVELNCKLDGRPFNLRRVQRENWVKKRGSSEAVYPTAMEKSQLVEFIFTEVLRNLFPMWADADMLDAHGYTRGITRKAAVAATGTITIQGAEGTEIEAATEVTTTAERDGDRTISFLTVESVTIGVEGTVNVGIVAVEAGTAGNVAAGTINRFEYAPDGVEAVTNEQATSGGVDEEEDDPLRLRIIEYDQSQGESFVGSPTDYRRWALSVTGVGNARVVEPVDDSGLITIIITDNDGQAAEQELCDQVYEYIMCSKEPLMRKATIGASLRVISPSAVSLSISAFVSINETVTIEAAKEAFVDAVNEYLADIEDGVIRRNQIGKLLMSIKGVVDYSDLLINDSESNIVISQDELAAVSMESVVFTT